MRVFLVFLPGEREREERIMFITHLKPLQPKTAITDDLLPVDSVVRGMCTGSGIDGCREGISVQVAHATSFSLLV
jgi:hypothetical protein